MSCDTDTDESPPPQSSSFYSATISDAEIIENNSTITTPFQHGLHFNTFPLMSSVSKQRQQQREQLEKQPKPTIARTENIYSVQFNLDNARKDGNHRGSNHWANNVIYHSIANLKKAASSSKTSSTFINMDGCCEDYSAYIQQQWPSFVQVYPTNPSVTNISEITQSERRFAIAYALLSLFFGCLPLAIPGLVMAVQNNGSSKRHRLTHAASLLLSTLAIAIGTTVLLVASLVMYRKFSTIV